MDPIERFCRMLDKENEEDLLVFSPRVMVRPVEPETHLSDDERYSKAMAEFCCGWRR